MKKPRMMPKALIFDMDGVLVDSMPYHYLAWKKTLAMFGIPVSKKEVYQKEGEDWRITLRDFLRKKDVKVSFKKALGIMEQRSAFLRKLLKPRLFDGAETLLKKLNRKGMRLALVTATAHKNITHLLPARIIKLFDCIIAGDNVRKGKPHPRPYLRALDALGIEAKDAFVIENSPLGITSAKKAGLFCIAVETSLPRKFLKGADIVTGSLKEAGVIILRLRQNEPFA